jgi:hypothetical protein
LSSVPAHGAKIRGRAGGVFGPWSAFGLVGGAGRTFEEGDHVKAPVRAIDSVFNYLLASTYNFI